MHTEGDRGFIPYHFSTKSGKGFTLIELLVVIAIIGILSAVVLASLNSARGKGSDAAVQSDFNTIQIEAEMYYGIANSYGTRAAVSGAAATCSGGSAHMFTDQTIINALNAADSANGAGNVICAAAASSYIVGAQLVSASGWWCVDSSGVSKVESSPLPISTTPVPVACP